jgi:hypothetical protein
MDDAEDDPRGKAGRAVAGEFRAFVVEPPNKGTCGDDFGFTLISADSLAEAFAADNRGVGSSPVSFVGVNAAALP